MSRIILPEKPPKRYDDVFDYSAQPKEWVERCNLCGSDSWGGLLGHNIDRYGYPVRMATCGGCGLYYIKERMTPEAYARFYADGTYRKLVSAFHGREINAQTIQPEQLVYAMELADFIGPYIGKAETLLDIGGSTGVVAGYLAQKFALVGTVLDPAPQELEQAHGLLKIQSTVEDWEPNGRTWDVITLCQTVDHLLDPMGVLVKLRRSLRFPMRPVLFVDALDYEQTRTIKIDHPYNFTAATAARLLERSGWSIEKSEPHGQHVRFVCVPNWVWGATA
jgi:2-polyprenyl-3-methyl-5-hydroxy-6-metoxy-1,4-benzoquinol methylase